MAQASPAKAPRQVEEDGRSWEMKAGMILEVQLRNFMCHEVNIQKYLVKDNLIFTRVSTTFKTRGSTS